MTDSVKQLLTMDIELKEELNAMFRKIIRRFLVLKVIISACTVIIIVTIFLYVTDQNKAEHLVFQAIQKEREMLAKEREQLRVERWNLDQYKNKKAGRKYGKTDSHTDSIVSDP